MLGKIRAAIAELGFVDALFYGLDRALRRAFGAAILFRYALVAQPVQDRPLLPARRGREFEIRLLAGPDPLLAEVELDDHVVAYRFGQGAICFGAFKEGQIVGCLWLRLGPYEEDEVRCRFIPLPENAACWDLGLYVSPQLRGGLLFARLWDEANAYLRERGVKWTLSRIGIANMSSLGSHARLGARRFGTATYLCFGRMQIMLTSLRPALHVSFGVKSMPTLRLVSPTNPSVSMNDIPDRGALSAVVSQSEAAREEKSTYVAPGIKTLIFDDIAAMPERYQVFLREAWRGDFFKSAVWFDLLARHTLSDGRALRIYAAEHAHDETILGLLFMATETHRAAARARRLFSLTNFYTMSFEPVLAEPNAGYEPTIRALTRAIADERPRWGVIDLRCLVLESPITQCLLKNFRAIGLLADTYFQFENWYHPTSGVSGSAYFKSRPSQLRNTVTRRAKKAAKEHKIEFRLITDPADVTRGLADYDKVYASSWKDPEKFAGFIPDLMQTTAELGMLRLGLLYVDDMPAASQLWLVTPARAIIYKLAYDEAYASLSVGSILTKHMFDHVLDVDKAVEVDYGVGSERYKLDWMSQKRHIVGLFACSPWSAHGLYVSARHFAAKMIRWWRRRANSSGTG